MVELQDTLPTRTSRYLSRLKKAATLNIMVQLFSSFGLAFASYYFKLQGLEIYKIVLIWAIAPLASIPVVALATSWNIKWRLRCGLLAFTGMSLSLLFYNSYSYILYGISGGLVLGFFWVSFNYLFFLKSTKNEHARDSSIYFILGPVIGIVLPPLGAVVIDGFGYKALFFATVLLSLVPLLYVRGQYFEHTARQTLKEADKNFSGLRLIEFFNGALHYFQGNFLGIYALLFLKTEYEVGGLLSYLAFISLGVAFLVAHISDRSSKRLTMLYPLLIIMGVLILTIPAIHSLSVLVVVIGVIACLHNLSMPLRFAVVMDSKTTDIGFWRMSELYGNIGRTVIFVLTSWLLFIGNRWLAFGVFGIMAIVFPFVMSWKTRKL
jgi:MFS family permease